MVTASLSGASSKKKRKIRETLRTLSADSDSDTEDMKVTHRKRKTDQSTHRKFDRHETSRLQEMPSPNVNNLGNLAMHNDKKLQSTQQYPVQGANTWPQNYLYPTQVFYMYSAAIQSGLHNQMYHSILSVVPKIEQERGSSADGKESRKKKPNKKSSGGSKSKKKVSVM